MAFNVINLQEAIDSSTGAMPSGFLDALNTALTAAGIQMTAETPEAGVNGYRFTAGGSTVATVIGAGEYTRLTVGSVTAQNYTNAGGYPTIIYNSSVVAILCRTSINDSPNCGYFISKTNAGTTVFVGSANVAASANLLNNPFTIASGDVAVLGATITPAQAQGTFTGFNVPYTGGDYCEHVAYCPFASAVANDTKPGTINGSPAYLVGGAWILTE